MKQTAMLWKEQKAYVRGEPIRYRLYWLRFDTFAICIRYRGDCQKGIFRAAREDAEALFCQVVQGLVTPCTLTDILTDFAFRAGIC